MKASQHAAGNCMALITIWLAWAVLAPIAAGWPEIRMPRHECPRPYMSHGVGSDLKTFVRPADRCRSHE